MDEPRPQVRIGDRERREVDTRLQKAYADGVLTMTEYEERSAQCWAARTRSELDPLTADLPDPDPDPAAAPTKAVAETPPAEPAPAPGHSLHRRAKGGLIGVVAVAAGLFAGSQLFFADDGFSAFGGQVVNVAPGDDRVEVGFLFGGTRVVVPADANVRTEGITLFGGTSCRAACDGTGTREVVVDANGAFGGLNIVRVGEADDDDNRGNNRDYNDGNNGNNGNDDGGDDGGDDDGGDDDGGDDED